jgi:hypothetical protein
MFKPGLGLVVETLALTAEELAEPGILKKIKI